MKRYIYIIILATAFAGCIKDNFDKVPNTSSDGSVSLNIAVPAPMVKDMGRTRGVRDFDKFENINIMIAAGDNDESAILDNLYFSFDDTSELPEGIEYEERNGNYGIHFAKEWFQDNEIDPAEIKFIIVGNYGSEIDIDDFETVGDLRNDLKYLSSSSDAPPGSPGYNVMYGESEDLSAGDSAHIAHVDGEGHENGRTLKVELQRLAAMITVKIDGSGLNPNVEIIPKRISLHNVPSWSYVAKPNNIFTDDDGEWIDGESIDVGAQVGGSVGRNAGTSPLSHNVKPTFGWHYTDEEIGGSEKTPVFSGEFGEVPALFMLENIHGDGFGATDGVNTSTGYGKRPKGVANNEAAILAADATKHSSYLEVEAEYLQYSNSTDVVSGNVVQGGTIVYRVFLGENLVENFDVRRNTYYRYTLMLSGTGIGEGDASWRLDTDLSTQSVLDESDFILNGAGEMIFINELITKLNSNMEIHHVGNTARQVNGSVYMHFVVGNAWRDFPLDAEQKYNGLGYDVVDPTNTSHSQFRLYVDPMGEEDGIGGNQGYMRKLTFHFETTSNHYTSKDITITQYAPTVTSLTEENTPEEIKIYINDVLNRSLPMTIYFDRVDRNAEQWGFDGESVANDPFGSGQANGIALINNSSAASSYMPFGKPSAMMHAAFINYYQWVTSDFRANTVHTPAPTIDALRNYAQVDYNPQDPIVPNSIPSSAEWKLLEMLDEAGYDVFDKVRGHDIIPWQPYWTSDAVEESTTQSIAYRRNATSTDGFVNVDRISPMPYRMIYIDQE